MTNFRFDLRPLGDDVQDDLRGLCITAGGTVLTRLLRLNGNAPDDAVRVPAIPLGFWLADHWWRLRWECRPPNGFTPEWRQAHDLGAIGNGHVWPRVTIWGEGDRVAVVSRADPVGVASPVRFLQDALAFVPSGEFEAIIDGALAAIGQIASGADEPALAALTYALSQERADPVVSAWRRLEAISGFDPDEAPESLIEHLLRLSERIGPADVEEASAAMPGEGAAKALDAVLDAADACYSEVSFDRAIRAVAELPAAQRGEPWQLAEAAARQVRAALNAGDNPLLNRRLGELAGISPRLLGDRAGRSRFPYGVRRAVRRDLVLLHSRWGYDRRFELMRALGDAIWSANSPFGPISRAGTARQKFQRAFAASLLCPAAALQSFLGTDDPADEDISAAARHFHVADKVVRTILVNKRMMDRTRLPLRPGEMQGNSIEGLADAA